MNNNVKKVATTLTLATSILLTSMPTSLADEPKDRSAIPEKYKWRLEDIYGDQDLWEKDFKKVEKELLPKIDDFKGKLNTADNVLACLKLYDELSRTMDKVYVYAHLMADQNQANNQVLEMGARTESLYAKLLAASSYIQPELIELPETKIKELLKSPKLENYQHLLDSLFKRKEHTLSQKEEAILAGSAELAGAPQDIFNKVAYADMTFPKIKNEKGQDIQLSEGGLSRYLQNSNRDFRKRAFEGVLGAYQGQKNTLAASLNAEVKKNVFYAQVRKYPSALEASLAGEHIPEEVFDNLIAEVNNNLSSLHKYISLKKKVLALDEVRSYDLAIPLVKEQKVEINYEDAQKMILNGLKPLGAKYLADLEKGFNSNWIDVYETKNKRTGGYNWGSYDTHPYILLNYTDTVDSMLTTAHEMGHALNSYYTNANQTYANAGIPIFTAEVASTTNEILMLNYLIKNAKSEAEKLYYMDRFIDLMRGTIFSQAMYSEFEKEIHERIEQGAALSSDSFSAIWKGLLEKYYGADYEADEKAALGWARIPHFYMNFYVYKYATSMSASLKISQDLLAGNEEAVAKYLNFLQAGSSDYPIEVLKKAGVDMTSPEVIKGAIAEFAKQVDEMERLMTK